MKRTKLMLGTMILSLGMAGAAWAQPAPNHDRDATVYSGYNHDRSDNNRAPRGDQDDRSWRSSGDRDRDDNYSVWNSRGDRDRDDQYGVWNTRGDRDDQDVSRGNHDRRSSRNWGYSNMRGGRRDDR
ncbi:MAG: hypothetical protein ACR2IF_12890 [Terriglobales bacterium]